MITYQILAAAQASLDILDTDERYANQTTEDRLGGLGIGPRSLQRFVENQAVESHNDFTQGLLLGVISQQIWDDLGAITNNSRLEEMAPLSEEEAYDDDVDCYFLLFEEQPPEGISPEDLLELGVSRLEEETIFGIDFDDLENLFESFESFTDEDPEPEAT